MQEKIIETLKSRMAKSIEAFRHELTGIRGNRASVGLLDTIRVDYYGTPTPLNQVATLSTPEPRLITITPWDKTAISEIEKALQKSDIGITPSNDGAMIRLALPPLSEERRRELVKIVKKMAEDAKISLRHIRRDGNDELKTALKNKEIPEDFEKRLLKEVQELTDDYTKKIDELFSHKESDIMEV